MATGGYWGVGSLSRKGKGYYFGVGNAARKVKKMYFGDAAGTARLCYKEYTPPEIGNILINYNGTLTYPIVFANDALSGAETLSLKYGYSATTFFIMIGISNITSPVPYEISCNFGSVAVYALDSVTGDTATLAEYSNTGSSKGTTPNAIHGLLIQKYGSKTGGSFDTLKIGDLDIIANKEKFRGLKYVQIID